MVHYVNENQGDGSPVVHMIGQGRSLWPAPINIAETGESRIIRLLAIEGPEGVFPRFGYHSPAASSRQVHGQPCLLGYRQIIGFSSSGGTIAPKGTAPHAIRDIGRTYPAIENRRRLRLFGSRRLFTYGPSFGRSEKETGVAGVQAFLAGELSRGATVGNRHGGGLLARKRWA